ncbi:MAG: SUMF1/EgtB/PvdO family nonheme iron enzyme [Verrucomicrobia bacterium]|nr:SUMF1/EgtB/PvdO family nonheme iron enzyme [Verrucomicrobiota bacterium]
MKTKLLAPLAGFILLAGNLLGQVPQLLNYQGRVAVGTVNFEGSGQFRFALVNAAGTTSYWSNDGTSVAGSQPTAAVPLTVTKGLYSVLLGDTTLTNMTAIPNSVFNNPDVRLRVWFDDGPHGPQLLTPDQRIAAVGYAMMADNVKDGAITSAQIAAGAVGTPQLANFAITGDKLRLGYEAGTLADGALVAAAGTFTFTRTFAYPFTVPPALNLLTPGWTPGPVTAAGFSATIAAQAPLTLDSTGYVGQHCSVAVVDGNPAISYFDATNGNLKFVRAYNAAGTAWDLPVTVDTGGTGIAGQYTSLAVVNGLPAISYYDATNGNLKYVHANNPDGAFWAPPVTVDTGGTGTVGRFTSLAVVDGMPAISYFDDTNADLKYVRATDGIGGTWGAPITLDSTGSVGFCTSLEVVNGKPAISYYDQTNGDLKYVSATDASGTVWGTPMTFDSTGDVGEYNALAVVNGFPAISYYDTTNGDLKFIAISEPELRWQASDGSIAPLTAATVTAGAIGSEQLAINAVQSGNIATGAIGSNQLDPAIGLWTKNGSDISYLAGRVGIGTASPGEGLEIGQSQNLLMRAAADDAGDIIFTTSALVQKGRVFTNPAAGVNKLHLSSSDNNPDLTIDEAGRVGIGTSSPTTALEVTGTAKATAFSGAFSGDGSGLTHIPASAVVTAPPGMVLIPAGDFTMGDSLDGMGDATPITVTLSAFYMAVNEVTLSQWQAVYLWATSHGYTFTNAGLGKSANHPVHTVNWHDVVKWCNARSEMEGLTPCYGILIMPMYYIYKTGEYDTVIFNVTANGYRLPTEAEWEKAARGGLVGQRFPWGDTITQNLANYNGNTSYTYDLGPNGYNSIGYVAPSPYTTPVGTFAPNGYGLNDMAGNVREWCWDCYAPYEGGTDPRGPITGSYRVIRGGLWSGNAGYCRVAYRDYRSPSVLDFGIGFRMARSSVP